MATPPLYPLMFEPILLPKVWGGRRLAALGKKLAAGANVGESWEIADLGETTAGGAGGKAMRSVIVNGALAGKTLHDAIAAWGPELIGLARLTPTNDFPLLVKFLDASDNLSLQVHPSPAYAAAHPQAHLKHECWYVVSAEPKSVIYKGLKPGVTRAALAAHVEDGGVIDDIQAVPAVPGECHSLPSGTIHALGKGVVVAEVQTPSDTTFRVYDWGRADRQLHVQPALECVQVGPAPAAVASPATTATDARFRLVTNECFAVEEVVTTRPVMESSHALIVISGEIMVEPSGVVGAATARARAGGCVVLPAGRRWSAAPQLNGGARYLSVTLRM